MGRVRITSRIMPWTVEQGRKADLAVLKMAVDIDRVAKMLAPHETGALQSSGTVERIGQAHYQVRYGGGSVPYARRRHFENKRNPGTLLYLERAGDSTARNARRYMAGI